jgi:hypothetical protein
MQNPTNEYIQGLCDAFRSHDIADVELSIELLWQLDLDSIDLRQLKKLANCIKWNKTRFSRPSNIVSYSDIIPIEKRIHDIYNGRKVQAFREYTKKLKIQESEKLKSRYR